MAGNFLHQLMSNNQSINQSIIMCTVLVYSTIEQAEVILFILQIHINALKQIHIINIFQDILTSRDLSILAETKGLKSHFVSAESRLNQSVFILCQFNTFTFSLAFS